MPVCNPNYGPALEKIDSKIKQTEANHKKTAMQLEQITSELESLINEIKNGKKDYPILQYSLDDNGASIWSKGKMVWWTKIPEACYYRLRLLIQGNEIDIIEIDRNKAYHNFHDLEGENIYTVILEVESRDGNIIKSARIKI